MTAKQARQPRPCCCARPAAFGGSCIFRCAVGVSFGLRTISFLTFYRTSAASFIISTCTAALASPRPSCVIPDKWPDFSEPPLPGLRTWGGRAALGGNPSSACEAPRTVLGIAEVGSGCWLSGLMAFLRPRVLGCHSPSPQDRHLCCL